MSRTIPPAATAAIAIAVAVAALIVGSEGLHNASSTIGNTAPAPATSTAGEALSGPILQALAGAKLVTAAGSIDPRAVDKMLVAIPDSAPSSMAGYSREAFGPAWADTDHNGCDQRNDVLRRDMAHIALKPGTHDCVVLTGTLADAYTGKTIDFTRGERTSTAVQIDHIVPLGWAWQHGAASWSPQRREQLATDFNELQAVDGPANEAKGDDGPADWMPANPAYRCAYVTRFVFITHTYRLTIDPADKTAINQTLSACH